LWEKLPKWLAYMPVQTTLIIDKKRDAINGLFHGLEALITEGVLEYRVYYLLNPAEHLSIPLA
jgi:hypothetical protein